MRGISETSVSTVGAYATPSEGGGFHDHGEGSGSGHPAPPVLDRPTDVSPLTPPSATGFGANDYLGARARASGEGQSPTQRRSNFSEGLDENLGK
jgi:hypothetical protein